MYRPGTSTLAIQCDNGYELSPDLPLIITILIFDCSCVYLHADGSTCKFEIVRAIRGHFTAGMAWGAHASSNHLFASSASPTDGTGHHKMFDVVHNKMVVEFDAKREACSTLALDHSGKRPHSIRCPYTPLSNIVVTQANGCS